MYQQSAQKKLREQYLNSFIISLSFFSIPECFLTFMKTFTLTNVESKQGAITKLKKKEQKYNSFSL